MEPVSWRLGFAPPATPLKRRLLVYFRSGAYTNALLITSRDQEEDFGPNLTIEPQRIDANRLLPFINAYLTASAQSELADSDLFDASRRLS
jgi:hypothetical protein